MNKQQLIVELQSAGLKLATEEIGCTGRIGGAGPSDHKAVTIDDTTNVELVERDVKYDYTVNGENIDLTIKLEFVVIVAEDQG